MGELNLYYPQWQGGGKQKTLYLGAAAARKGHFHSINPHRRCAIDLN